MKEEKFEVLMKITQLLMYFLILPVFFLVARPIFLIEKIPEFIIFSGVFFMIITRIKIFDGIKRDRIYHFFIFCFHAPLAVWGVIYAMLYVNGFI